MKALVYMHVAHLNTREGEFFVSDKLDAIIQVCRDSAVDLEFVVIGQTKLRSTSKIPYSPLLKLVGDKEILRTSVLDLFLSHKIPEFFGISKKKSGLDPRRKELRHFWFENCWKKLLSENQIKLVFGIGLTPSLVSASKELGIKTVEVQHGILSELGAKKYWASSQPDIFLSWDSYSSQNAKKFICDVRELGHPILDHGSSSATDSYGQKELQAKFCVALQYKRFGVFTIPWISPKLVKLLRNQNLIGISELVFRMHPVIESKVTQRMILMTLLFTRFSKSQIHLPRKFALSETILSTRGVLTDSSSVAYEYALFGKPSLVLDSYVRSAFQIMFSQSGLHKDLIHDQIESFSMAAKRVSRKKRGGFKKSVIQELLRENM